LGDKKQKNITNTAFVKQKKNPRRTLGERPERNIQLGISRRGMEYNIKMGLNEMVRGEPWLIHVALVSVVIYLKFHKMLGIWL
jgi:hypothetical protein